ncbi:MAG: hypothetical protein FJZ00_07615, partial [Candidatus Sericytochromatia bacterium]|nr:hypothetical protein [Candidatus Tanganyikabacteria bacterium]
VADVGVGAGKGIVSGLAITGVTMGMTAIGLTAAPFLLTVPVMLGASIAANWLTHRLMNKGLEKTQLHKKISDGVTKLFGGD